MSGESRVNNNRFKILMIDSVILVLSLTFLVLSYILFDQLILKILLMLFFTSVTVITIIRRILLVVQKEDLPEDNKMHYDDSHSLSLLNEYDEVVHMFNIDNMASVVIGRSTEDNQVDVDLGNSVYAALIHPVHATLNFAAGSWYLEDVAGINDLKIQPQDSGDSIFLISPDRPCKVERGDILFIANTRLLFQ